MNDDKETMELLEKSALIGAIDKVRITYMEGSEVYNAFRKLELAIFLMPSITIKCPSQDDFDNMERLINEL